MLLVSDVSFSVVVIFCVYLWYFRFLIFMSVSVPYSNILGADNILISVRDVLCVQL